VTLTGTVLVAVHKGYLPYSVGIIAGFLLILWGVNIATGFMLAQFTKHLRNLPVDPDIQLNLLTSEITVSP